MTQRSVPAARTAASIAPLWQALDLHLFAWVGGGHAARPRTLALACALGLR